MLCVITVCADAWGIGYLFLCIDSTVYSKSLICMSKRYVYNYIRFTKKPERLIGCFISTHLIRSRE